MRSAALAIAAALLVAAPVVAQEPADGQSAAEYERQLIEEGIGKGQTLAPAPPPVGPDGPTGDEMAPAEPDPKALIGALVALVIGIGLFVDLRRMIA